MENAEFGRQEMVILRNVFDLLDIRPKMLLSLVDTGKILGVNPRVVDNFITSGLLQEEKSPEGGRRRYVSAISVAALLAQQYHPSSELFRDDAEGAGDGK